MANVRSEFELSQMQMDEFEAMDQIIEDEDIQALYLLSDNRIFSIALKQILINRCEYDLILLNAHQRALFLCMSLEDAGQADHILEFLQMNFPDYANEAVSALEKIGANQSSAIIQQAIELLPEDGTWFFDTADEASVKLMSKLDSDFSSYPDGWMPDLYRKYAEEHRSEMW